MIHFLPVAIVRGLVVYFILFYCLELSSIAEEHFLFILSLSLLLAASMDGNSNFMMDGVVIQICRGAGNIMVHKK